MVINRDINDKIIAPNTSKQTGRLVTEVLNELEGAPIIAGIKAVLQKFRSEIDILKGRVDILENPKRRRN